MAPDVLPCPLAMSAKKATKKQSKKASTKKTAAKKAPAQKKSATKKRVKKVAKKNAKKVAAHRAPKKKLNDKSLSKPCSEEEIRHAAYLNSCARIAAGHPPDETADWLAAERALRS